MALNVVTLTAGIRAAFIAGGADPGSALTIALCAGIAQAIITEFQTNADVVPATGVPPLTVALPAPQPVLGLGKIA